MVPSVTAQELLPRLSPRRASRVRFRLTLAIVAVAVVCGVVVGVLAPHHGGTTRHHTDALNVIGLCTSGLGLLGAAVTVLWAWRTGAFTRARQSRLLDLDRPTRRRVIRAVRGHAPVSPQDRAFAIATAHAWTDRNWQLALNSSSLLLFAGQLLDGGTTTSRLLTAAAVALIGAGTFHIGSDARHARRFIAVMDTDMRGDGHGS